MLLHLAIAKSTWKTAGGLVALTAVSFLVTGYRYGIDDHIVHLPRLFRILDPQLYAPDDPFIQAQATHYSLFWYGIAPLTQLLPDPLLFLLLSFALRFFYATMLWRLAFLLFGDPRVAWLGTAALLVDKLTFGFYILPDRSLLDRTFALPFVVLALERFLAGRRLLPFAVTGLLVNVHVLSALYALPLLAVGSLAEVRQKGITPLVLGLSVFLLAGLPIWWWRVQSPNDLPLLVPDPQWLAIVKAAVLTLLNILVPDVIHLVAFLSGLGFLGGYVLATKGLPGPQHQIVRLWMITAACLVGAAVVFTDLWPVAAVLQLQLIRVSQWLVIFPTLYLAYLFLRSLQQATLPLPAFVTGAGVFILSPFGFLPVLALAPSLLPRSLPWWVRGGTLAGGHLAALALAGLYLSLKLQAWPFIFAPPENAWWEVERWARYNTPKEAVFLIPPHFRGAEMGSEFRVVAQRSTVVTYAEGGEASFNRAFALSWYQRMYDLTNGAFSLDAPFENTLERMRAGFQALSQEQLLELAHRYRAAYILLEASRSFPKAPLFKNSEYALYPTNLSPTQKDR